MVNVLDYGADPTGATDSTAALNDAIAAAIALGASAALSSLPFSTSTTFDLGGVSVDFAGGRYQISAPVVVAAGVSNINFIDGTLVASSEFDQTSYLFHVGNGTCTHGSGLSCTGVMSITQMVLDSNNTAYGSLLLDNVEFVDVSSVLMIGFTGIGCNLLSSGGVFIHHSWIGQFSVFNTVRDTDVTATCLTMLGSTHDSIVQDVIIFSGRTGIETDNSGNMIDGVHVWNLIGSVGGVGMLVQGGVRIVNSYFDYTPLVIVNPSGATVVNNYFYQTANIVLRANASDSPVPVYLLLVSNNWFEASNATLIVDEGANTFGSLSESIIENNVATKSVFKRSTRATLKQQVSDGVSTTLDFTTYLAFPGIAIVEARCFLSSPTPAALSTVIDGLKLTVHFSMSVTGVVLCDVDQSTRWHPGH